MKDIYEALNFMIERDEPINVIVRALKHAFFITHDESYRANMTREMIFDELSSECVYWKNCLRHSFIIENILDLINNNNLSIEDIHIRDDKNIVVNPYTLTNDEIEEYNYNLKSFKDSDDEAYLKSAMEIMYYKDPVACHILKSYLDAFNNVFIYLINTKQEEKGRVMVPRFLHYLHSDNKELNKDDYKRYLKSLFKIVNSHEL